MLFLTHSQTGLEKGKGNKMYTVKLTAKQLDALYIAIECHRASYAEYTEEELRWYGINPIFSSLRQVEAKLDNATEKAGN